VKRALLWIKEALRRKEVESSLRKEGVNEVVVLQPQRGEPNKSKCDSLRGSSRMEYMGICYSKAGATQVLLHSLGLEGKLS